MKEADGRYTVIKMARGGLDDSLWCKRLIYTINSKLIDVNVTAQEPFLGKQQNI